MSSTLDSTLLSLGVRVRLKNKPKLRPRKVMTLVGALYVFPGDRMNSKLTISKEKNCPKELPGANLQVGNISQIAGQSEETLEHRQKHACCPQTSSSRRDPPGEKGQGRSPGEGREMQGSSCGGKQDLVVAVWEILYPELQPRQAPSHP